MSGDRIADEVSVLLTHAGTTHRLFAAYGRTARQRFLAI
jgi:hypothetical protein